MSEEFSREKILAGNVAHAELAEPPPVLRPAKAKDVKKATRPQRERELSIEERMATKAARARALADARKKAESGKGEVPDKKRSFYIRDDQDRALDKLVSDTGDSASAHVRDALDWYFAHFTTMQNEKARPRANGYANGHHEEADDQ